MMKQNKLLSYIFISFFVLAMFISVIPTVKATIASVPYNTAWVNGRETSIWDPNIGNTFSYVGSSPYLSISDYISVPNTYSYITWSSGSGNSTWFTFANTGLTSATVLYDIQLTLYYKAVSTGSEDSSLKCGYSNTNGGTVPGTFIYTYQGDDSLQATTSSLYWVDTASELDDFKIYFAPRSGQYSEIQVDAAKITYTLYNPAITITPTSGVVGTSVTATGTGFGLSKTLTAYLGTRIVNNTVTSNSTGGFTLKFNVPTSFPYSSNGVYNVTVTDALGISAFLPFTIGTVSTFWSDDFEGNLTADWAVTHSTNSTFHVDNSTSYSASQSFFANSTLTTTQAYALRTYTNTSSIHYKTWLYIPSNVTFNGVNNTNDANGILLGELMNNTKTTIQMELYRNSTGFFVTNGVNLTESFAITPDLWHRLDVYWSVNSYNVSACLDYVFQRNWTITNNPATIDRIYLGDVSITANVSKGAVYFDDMILDTDMNHKINVTFTSNYPNFNGYTQISANSTYIDFPQSYIFDKNDNITDIIFNPSESNATTRYIFNDNVSSILNDLVTPGSVNKTTFILNTPYTVNNSEIITIYYYPQYLVNIGVNRTLASDGSYNYNGNITNSGPSWHNGSSTGTLTGYAYEGYQFDKWVVSGTISLTQTGNSYNSPIITATYVVNGPGNITLYFKPSVVTGMGTFGIQIVEMAVGFLLLLFGTVIISSKGSNWVIKLILIFTGFGLQVVLAFPNIGGVILFVGEMILLLWITYKSKFSKVGRLIK